MRNEARKSSNAWAIKVGGSLYTSHYLIQWLAAINDYSNKNVVIIPGGGPFADQVRETDAKFNLLDEYAHNMAVLAMQQFGYLLASLQPAMALANSTEKVLQAWNKSKTAIWEPYEMVRDQCVLEKSWDITSDSLALWLASILNIPNVLLIKSSPEVLEGKSLTTLAQNECVDSVLPELANQYQIKVAILHKSKVSELPDLLATG